MTYLNIFVPHGYINSGGRPANCLRQPACAMIALTALLTSQADAQSAKPNEVKHQLVEVQKINANIVVDLRYATADNFVGVVLYEHAKCLLAQPVAERLSRVQARLEKDGYGLKIFDAYRPRRFQYKLWELKPVPGYVADPKYGSNHNRGAAVDVTLVKDGKEIIMPTPYDAFTPAARRTAVAGILPEALANRKRLQDAMTAEGFKMINSEWWHFDAPDAKNFPVLDLDFTEIE